MAGGKKGNVVPGKRQRGQAAVEYLTTFGIAILIIVVMAGLIYFFVAVPQNTAPNSCSFGGYFSCETLELGSNGLASRAILLLSNTQQYAVTNATAIINISSVGSFSGACNPKFILSGGITECVINFNRQLTAKQFISGAVYLSATICAKPTETGCAAPTQQTFGGTYTAHISPLIPPPGCSVTLGASNSTQFTTGKDLLEANAKIQGLNVGGATVNFTSQTQNAMVSPQFANTNSNGNATSYFSYNTTGYATAEASFENCTATVRINFEKPVYITFASNVSSTGSPMLSLNGTLYSYLPKTIPVLTGTSHPYSYNSLVSISRGSRYSYNSISGCGTSLQSGALISDTNCTVTAKYNTQYLLNVSATTGGSATPSATWEYPGTGVSLSETPNTGYNFMGWTCAGTGCYSGSSTNPTVTVESPVNETANFEIQTFSLTETPSPSGGGTLSPGSGTYDYGSQVTISETPASQYTFTGWSCSGAGCYSGSNTMANVIITSNVIETASYYPYQPFTESSSPGGGGTLSPGSGSYPVNTLVSFSETTNYGYTFTDWTCSGTGCYSGSSTSGSVTMAGPITETANYNADPETLTVNNDGCSGVSGGGTYGYSSSASFSVSVPTGYTFDGWSGSGSGSYSGGATSTSVTMDNAITETATCSVSYYTVTIESYSNEYGYGYGGNVSIEGYTGYSTLVSASIPYGTEITVSALADGVDTFGEWSGGPISGSTTTPGSFTVTGASTFSANFNYVGGSTGSGGADGGNAGGCGGGDGGDGGCGGGS